jgi:broad specificity phosphatase PhoE
VRLLGEEKIEAIFTSQYARTKETAEPLARRFGIVPVVVPLGADATTPSGISEASIRAIVEKILEHKGGKVVVVGHSNSIPAVVTAFGARAIPPIEENDYKFIYVLTLFSDGRTNVVGMTYGKP